VLRVLVLQVVHEGIPLALHLRLLEAGEGFQALGGDDGVPALRGVHQPYVGEAPGAVAQGPVFPRVLGIVRRDHVGARPLGICTGGRAERGQGRPRGAPLLWGGGGVLRFGDGEGVLSLKL